MEFMEAPNSLSPASMVVGYHSAFGAHKMTIPTLAWFPTNITGDLGSYAAWNLGTCDAEEMVTELIDVLKVFYTNTVHFDSATVYTQATPTSPNIPQRSIPLAIAGTSVSTGYSAAISTTFNFKTVANGNARLVLLDSPLGSGGFAPIYPADFTSDVQDVVDIFTADVWAWSGRDDSQPRQCRKVSFDLNDKLQKEYGLV